MSVAQGKVRATNPNVALATSLSGFLLRAMPRHCTWGRWQEEVAFVIRTRRARPSEGLMPVGGPDYSAALYPEHFTTGSRGYFGYASSVEDSPHK